MSLKSECQCILNYCHCIENDCAHRRVNATDLHWINLQTVKSYALCMCHWIEFLQNERWKCSALICSYLTCNNFLFSLPLSLSMKNFFVFITLRKEELLLELGLRQSTAEKLFDEVLSLTEEVVRMIIDQNHSHWNDRNAIIRMSHYSCGHLHSLYGWLVQTLPDFILFRAVWYIMISQAVYKSPALTLCLVTSIILNVSICLSLSCLPQAASGIVVNGLINNNLIIDCFHHELLN